MIDAGNSACASGLSGALYTALLADSSTGFSSPLSTPQDNAVKALCWNIANQFATAINAKAVRASDGVRTGDVGTLVFNGATVALDGDTATVTVSGGGGLSTEDVLTLILSALLAGPGAALKLAPAGITGDGAEHSHTISLPAGVTPVDGRHYGISGDVTIRDTGSGATVCTVTLRGVVLLRSSGAWVSQAAGTADVSPGTVDRATYYASDADLPGFGDASGALALFHQPLSGAAVSVEFDGTLRDLGTP